MPVHPEWYSDEFGRLLKRTGLRRITLHDSRHTTLTLMEHAGVPISIVSKWAGHYDAAFTQRTYVHASDDDLEQGRRAPCPHPQDRLATLDIMTSEDERRATGFRIAPEFRSDASSSLPAKIELNIFREIPNPFSELSASLGKSIAASIKPMVDSMAAAWARQLSQAFSFDFDRLIPKEAFERLREAVPPNWIAIEASDWDVDWDAALETMNEGIPLIWVPGPVTVGRLLKAESPEKRLEVLKESRQEIVGDCVAVLGEVTAPDLLPLAGLAAEAAGALHDGHCAASQALSANVFDTWLRGVVRRGGPVHYSGRGTFQLPPCTSTATTG